MKVVFDTNILVSAFTLPGGRGDQALGRIIQGADALAISKPIIDELLGVLARKFGHDREQLARTAVFLAELAEVVDPRDPLSVLTDEPDNRILECAVAAEAEPPGIAPCWAWGSTRASASSRSQTTWPETSGAPPNARL